MKLLKIEHKIMPCYHKGHKDRFSVVRIIYKEGKLPKSKTLLTDLTESQIKEYFKTI